MFLSRKCGDLNHFRLQIERYGKIKILANDENLKCRTVCLPCVDRAFPTEMVFFEDLHCKFFVRQLGYELAVGFVGYLLLRNKLLSCRKQIKLTLV